MLDSEAQEAVRPGRASARTAFVLVAFAFAATMLGTTLPTPLYPLYEGRFSFGGVMVTVIYATYAVGVLVALLLFGAVSDQIGRRRTLLAGLALSAASAVAFLAGTSVAILLVGRVLSGLSAGIFTGTATAALVELAPRERQRTASLVAAGVNTGGLGLGPLVAGVLSQYAVAPLRLPFLVDLGLIVLATISVAVMPEPVRDLRPLRLRLQRLRVPPEVRAIFVPAATAGFAAFAVFGLFAAVSPAFLGQVLHQHNRALTGLVVFSAFGASTVGQILSARAPGDRAMRLGAVGLALGMLVVATSLLTSSLPLLFIGALTCGFAHGLAFRAGLGMLNAASPAAERGEVNSTFFAILYVAISIPVIGVGLTAQAFGLVTAGVVFAVLVATLSLTAYAMLRWRPAGA